MKINIKNKSNLVGLLAGVIILLLIVVNSIEAQGIVFYMGMTYLLLFVPFTASKLFVESLLDFKYLNTWYDLTIAIIALTSLIFSIGAWGILLNWW